MSKDISRVTYSTTSLGDEALHAEFERSVALVQSDLGASHPIFVNGAARQAANWSIETAPADRRQIVGRFSRPTLADVDDAVRAAAAAQHQWADRPWAERVAVLRRVASLLEADRYQLAAVVAIEVGKTRLEALGDVDETTELIRVYCQELESHQGYRVPMGGLSPAERTLSLLRPYGAWAVISPFNFPLALGAGPAAAALIGGNTVVFKPSYRAYLSGLRLYDAMARAGVPAGAFQILTGGSQIGHALVAHPLIRGVTFTGSGAVGSWIRRVSARIPGRQAITEMGGKNPAIVSKNADVTAAAEGVARAAFGFSGQKCSACSRVYVEQPVLSEFTDALLKFTSGLQVGDPVDRDVFTGPVIDRKAVARFEQAVSQARSEGSILVGGAVGCPHGGEYGNFVQLTVVHVPDSSTLLRDELFVPILCVTPVESLSQGVEAANATEYGLTAGLYSTDPEEISYFLESVEAGVLYVNRRSGATTGAWPAVQTFSGWKASGSSGRGTGGPYYVQQYLREQSQTVMES
jgi:1-pyrroline-5-carboxylate dehydrogenase